MEKRVAEKAMASENGTPKKTRTVRKVAVTESEGSEDPKALVVRLEPDMLECPLCFAPFVASIFQASKQPSSSSSYVFLRSPGEVSASACLITQLLTMYRLINQCKNGHAACESCCARVQWQCPSCGEPIGAIRCRPLEQLIAGMVVPCAFRARGCKQLLRYAEKPTHEAVFCQHAPCYCPVPGCAYSGLLLHEHVRAAHAGAGAGDDDAVTFVDGEATVTLHRSMLFRVLLQHPPDSRVFLLLNGGEVPSGRSLSLLCVGPRPAAADQELEYTMVVRAGDEPRVLSLSAFGTVPCTRRWSGPGQAPAEGFLFVPDAYWSSSGCVSVAVHLRKKAAVEENP
ncbi:hypothetical protein EJB05_07404, partial [Eragrostis curvula]